TILLERIIFGNPDRRMRPDRMFWVGAAYSSRHRFDPLHIPCTVAVTAIRIPLELVGHGPHEQIRPVFIPFHQRIDPKILMLRIGPKSLPLLDFIAEDNQLDVHASVASIVKNPIQLLHRRLVNDSIVWLAWCTPESPMSVRHGHHADEVKLVSAPR